MKVKVMTTVLASAAVAVVAAMAVRAPATKLAESAVAPAQILVSSDGGSQVSLPDGWADVRNADELVQIKAIDTSSSTMLSAQSFDKDEYAQAFSNETFAAHVQTAANNTMDTPQVTEPARFNTGEGHPAVQYQIQGTIKGNGPAATMLSTLIETPTHYHILTTVTPTNQFENNQTEIQDVIKSFQEVQAAAPVK